VPGFRCSFLPDMPSSMTSGSSIVVFRPEHRRRHWPSSWTKELGTPNSPAIRFTRGQVFAATLVRNCYGLSGCWPPCTDLTGLPVNVGFYFQAFDGSVTLPVAGYNYNSVWTPLLAGLPPAGMAASLAALVRPGLTLIAHAKDSVWCVDLFRVESIHMRSHWVMLVMDVFTRRIIGFGIAPAC